MGAVNKLDKLIAAEAGEPVYVQLTQERLNGRVYGAYMFNGALLWWPIVPTELDPLPPGARPLYVTESDRG